MAPALTTTLQSYANLAQLLEEKWADPDVYILLYQREELADHFDELTLAEREILLQADAVLASKWQIVSDFVPLPMYRDRKRWWWFLNEGPQVREQAQELAHA